MVKTILVLLFILLLSILIALIWQAQKSQTLIQRYQDIDPGGSGPLPDCTDRPNCVCSETATPASHAIEPVVIEHGPTDEAWLKFQQAVRALGGNVRFVSDHRMWATFRTPLLGFTDDLLARLDSASGMIHVRSSSRVGHSDLGQNRKRIEALRNQFQNTLRTSDPSQ
ncbi:MAG: DUF1499 domain-containing protein [Gammaproteobacteria bacterium]|nr:MAG: DUF1499 domain-containing protein [Gammaproteobacteria bacterium]